MRTIGDFGRRCIWAMIASHAASQFQQQTVHGSVLKGASGWHILVVCKGGHGSTLVRGCPMQPVLEAALCGTAQTANAAACIP